MHSCCMFLVVYTCSGVQSMCSLFMVSAAFSFSVNMGMLIFVVGLMVITLISELLIEREGRGGEGGGGRKRGRERGREGGGGGEGGGEGDGEGGSFAIGQGDLQTVNSICHLSCDLTSVARQPLSPDSDL